MNGGELMWIGDSVSSTDKGVEYLLNSLDIFLMIFLGVYCGKQLANMIIKSKNGCRRHNLAVSKTKVLK